VILSPYVLFSVLGSQPPLKPLSSLSSMTGSSSLKRDELMDVGIEFMTSNDTCTKSSQPPHIDSTSASQPPSDSTATHRVPYFQCPVV